MRAGTKTDRGAGRDMKQAAKTWKTRGNGGQRMKTGAAA